MARNDVSVKVEGSSLNEEFHTVENSVKYFHEFSAFRPNENLISPKYFHGKCKRKKKKKKEQIEFLYLY